MKLAIQTGNANNIRCSANEICATVNPGEQEAYWQCAIDLAHLVKDEPRFSDDAKKKISAFFRSLASDRSLWGDELQWLGKDRRMSLDTDQEVNEKQRIVSRQRRTNVREIDIVALFKKMANHLTANECKHVLAIADKVRQGGDASVIAEYPWETFTFIGSGGVITWEVPPKARAAVKTYLNSQGAR